MTDKDETFPSGSDDADGFEPEEPEKPKTKTQPDKGGSGKPPRPTAVATGGGGRGGDRGGRGPKRNRPDGEGEDEDRGDQNLVPGQTVSCKILRPFKSGYLVYLTKYKRDAILVTDEDLAVGITVIATFDRRDSMSQIYLFLPSIQKAFWLQPHSLPTYSFLGPADSTGLPTMIAGGFYSSWIQAKESSSTPEGEAEQSQFQFKRATDLFPPPLEVDSFLQIKMNNYESEWLVSDLESGQRTGCVRLINDKEKSRGAILVYRGRVVGCVFNSIESPETQSTKESLPLFVPALKQTDTVVTLYDLPENLVLAKCSLFLGYPVQREDEYNSLDYYRYIMDWFKKEGGTACLAVSLSGGRGIVLGYVHQAELIGSFSVDEQIYSSEKEIFEALLEHDSECKMAISILPPEFAELFSTYGFKLSSF